MRHAPLGRARRAPTPLAAALAAVSLAAVSLVPLAALPLAAQTSADATSMATVAPSVTPSTIDACYVPVSGTIYRRSTAASPAPGAPANCLSASHVAFSILQSAGATVGPDLVYSGRIDMGQSARFGSSIFARDAMVPEALIPTGGGTRFMWLGQKGALRAGAVTDGRWDLAQIGDRSVALGRDVRASGADALALGFESIATGSASSAIGLRATAAAEASVAIGAGARAEHRGAVVLSDGLADTRPAAASTAQGQITLRARNGIRLRTGDDMSGGCDISTAGAVSCTGTVSGTILVGASYQRVLGSVVNIGPASTGTATLSCPSGYIIVGGGANTTNGDMKLRESYPSSTTAWFASARNDHPFNDGSIQAYALCLRN